MLAEGGMRSVHCPWPGRIPLESFDHQLRWTLRQLRQSYWYQSQPNDFDENLIHSDRKSSRST